MEVKTVTPDELEQILSNGKYDLNFFQTPDYIRMQHTKNREALIYVGYEDGKPVVILNVLLMPTFKLFKSASSPREWAWLVNEKDLSDGALQSFIDQVKADLKKRNVIFWSVESGIEVYELDTNGNHVEGGYDNADYRKKLQDLGFTARKLWKNGYFLRKQARTVSLIHLDDVKTNGYPLTSEQIENRTMRTMDDLLKVIPGNQRRRMKDDPHIKVVSVGVDGIPEFMELAACSEDRHDFEGPDAETMKNWLLGYGPKATLNIAYLDLAGMLAENKAIIEENEKLYEENKAAVEENPKLRKRRVAMNQAKEKIENANKKIEKITAIQDRYDPERTGKLIPAAGGLFVRSDSEMCYLFSGSRHDLVSVFNASYLLQKNMMQEAIDKGLSRYNFWGISGNYNPGDVGYGVFQFKQLLGGMPTEYCGEFTCNLNPVAGRMLEKKQEKIGLLEPAETL